MSETLVGARLLRGLVGGFIGALLTLCVLSCAGRLFVPELFDTSPPQPPGLKGPQNLLGIACVASAVAIGILIGLRSAKLPTEPPEGLNCRKCGCDLTGNTSVVCPECGEKI